jgi:hypothetical protein
MLAETHAKKVSSEWFETFKSASMLQERDTHHAAKNGVLREHLFRRMWETTFLMEKNTTLVLLIDFDTYATTAYVRVGGLGVESFSYKSPDLTTLQDLQKVARLLSTALTAVSELENCV